MSKRKIIPKAGKGARKGLAAVLAAVTAIAPQIILATGPVIVSLLTKKGK